MPKCEIINTTDWNGVTWKNCRFYLSKGGLPPGVWEWAGAVSGGTGLVWDTRRMDLFAYSEPASKRGPISRTEITEGDLIADIEAGPLRSSFHPCPGGPAHTIRMGPEAP